MVEEARAVILAQDDFSATDSGTGWAAGNAWEQLNLTNQNVESAAGNQSFRDFATPLDATNQVTYIRYDFQRTAGPNDTWGGIALFEGVEGNAGTETFFLGTAGGNTTLSIDTKQFGHFNSDILVDNQVHTLIAEIDTTGGNHAYRLWVDHVNVNAPNNTVLYEATETPIDAAWGTFRLASDAIVTDIIDNLTIATTAAEVGLIDVGDLQLTLDRSSGGAWLTSATNLGNVVGYSLHSYAGSMVAAEWTTIAGNYDSPAGDGSVDDDEWTVEESTTFLLKESTFDTTPGDGATLTSTPIDLGTPWVPSIHEDVIATVYVDMAGEIIPVRAAVNYTEDLLLGDLDADMDVDADDWGLFKLGQGSLTADMTLLETYQYGDMDGNGAHNLDDFIAFSAAYDAANGVGAFAALTASVPEPSSLVLIGLGLVAGLVRYRRSVVLPACCLLIATLLAAPRTAEAVVFASDDFSAVDSGTGWAAGDAWENLTGGVADTTVQAIAFRALETPLEPYLNDKVYVAFDFYTPTAGSWGGVAFFEEATGGDESLFIGKPGGIESYGADLKPGSFDSFIPVDLFTHHIIVGIDFNATETADSYSIWVDNYDINSPNNTTSIDIASSPINAAWQSIRIGSDASKQIVVDNLMVTDQGEEASLFALPEVLQVFVDKSTGEVTVENNIGSDVAIKAYSLLSNSGSLASAEGDFNNDGVTDLADYTVWRNNLGNAAGTLPNDPTGLAIGADQYQVWSDNFGESFGGSWDSLAEQDLTAFPAGDGSGNGWEEGAGPSPTEVTEYFLDGSSSFANGSSISLGQVYGGGVSGTQDIVFQYVSDGVLKQGLVSYVNGAGALSATSVPEPSTLITLALGGLLAACATRARR